MLPPGQAGTDNALQLAQFQADGTRPAHWSDQQSLYDDLIKASPGLKAEDVAKYYKDATFGVKEGEAESVVRPRDGVVIVRDKQYGVPRIYGDTFEDVQFGAGYAGAQDRLFLMDVLRHTGRAQLSSFVGGADGNRAQDRTQWALAPYKEEDFQLQIDKAEEVYGADGAKIKSAGQAFVDGINAYVAEALMNPLMMPAEYAAIAKTPEMWNLKDVIAEASLIGGIFGKGGGAEVQSAIILRQFEKRFGVKRGRRAWLDFRSKNDPEAPTTILKKRFPYQTASAFSKRGLAIPDAGSVMFTPPDKPEGQKAEPAPRATPAHASNWLLVPGRSTKSGKPIAVMGPQVGYYVPQILVEQELHGPGFDARGASFPGVNLMAQLGRGRDYAWSATTATSDNVDTFAEELCQDDFHYMYKGQCTQMEKLVRENSWSPNAADDTPAGSETLTVYRTVHGIVNARGTVGGKKVAFAQARTTYFHEADSALGFYKLNDPAQVHDYESFRRAIDGINFAFNWAYVDSKNIGYQLSGWYPQRAKGVSPDLPVWGTGEYDWKNWDPDLHTMATIPLDKRPHIKDQQYLVSWNNKQAPGWAAADDVWSYGPDHRQQMLTAFVRRALKGGKKIELHQLVQAMDEPATQDLRALRDLPIVAKILKPSKNAEVRSAMGRLEAWRRSGAHRRDLDGDKKFDDEAAVMLMDAWWPRLADAVFRPKLGDETLDTLRRINDYGDVRSSPAAPDFFAGFESWLSKDLRGLIQPKKVKGRWSVRYCGFGKLARCRKAIEDSLIAATAVTAKDLYGKGECESTPDPYCFDMNRPIVAVGVDVPPSPFQNRPTFQQTVEVPKSLPR